MALVAVRAAVYYIAGGGIGLDAHPYWAAGDLADPYGAGPGARDAYLYSPAFLQRNRSESGPVIVDVSSSDNVTPAVAGYACFVARGEWMNALRAALVSASLVAASYLLDPHLWHEWIRFLLGHQGESHNVVARGIAAALIAFVAGRYGIVWLLPLAAMVAMTMAGDGLGIGGQINSPFAMVAITIGVYWRTRPEPRVVRPARENRQPASYSRPRENADSRSSCE